MDHNYTSINKTNNHLSPKESLNSDRQQFREYHQNVQPPLTLYSVNINKTYNHLSPYTPWISTKRTTTSYLILREYQQNVQPPLTLYSVNINKTYNPLKHKVVFEGGD